jgi:hypothetical protein
MADLKAEEPVKGPSAADQQRSSALPTVERGELRRENAEAQASSKAHDGAIPPQQVRKPTIDPISALMSLLPKREDARHGMERHILELQDALLKLTNSDANREKGASSATPGLDSASLVSPQAGDGVIASAGLRNFVDPVRQVAVPQWVGSLLRSPIAHEQEVALLALAQLVVHVGLIREERQHPEQALKIADDCLARLKITDARMRERALKAIQSEAERRRTEAFTEEIRKESETRAIVDRVGEHAFFSVEDSLPGLEIYAQVPKLPGELHATYVESGEKTIALLCEEALARAAAGEEIPVRYLVTHAEVLLREAAQANPSLDVADLLIRIERQYEEALHKLYSERFPLEALHQLDLSLSKCKNLEEAFTHLSEVVPGGDRELFGSYALSTINRVAAHQNHDLGLLVGASTTFGIPLCGSPASSFQIRLPDTLRGRLNDGRVLEHARFYAGRPSEGELLVPDSLVPERLRLLVKNPQIDSNDGISGPLRLRIQKEPVRLDLQPSVPRFAEGSARVPLQLADRSTSSRDPLSHLSNPQEFLIEQLDQFVREKKDSPLRDYAASLMRSVEWVHYEFKPAADTEIANPFSPGEPHRGGLNLPNRGEPVQLLAPKEFQISPRRGVGGVEPSLESVGPTPLTRTHAALVIDVFERRVQSDFAQALTNRELFKLEQILDIVAQVEPSLRSIAGQDEGSPLLYEQLVKRAQRELAKDAVALPSSELPTYRALSFGFTNGWCTPVETAAPLQHLSQIRELPTVLHALARRSSPLRDLRPVHDTPTSPTSLEIARASRIEALRERSGIVGGQRSFVIESTHRLERYGELDNVELGPVESPRIIISSDTSVGDLCRAIFRTSQPMEGDIFVLASINPELAKGLLDGKVRASSVLPAGTTVRVQGTPLGFQIQQAASADRVQRLREELRVCRDATAKTELEHCLNVSEVFDSQVQREGNMLALQRTIDGIALEIEAASNFAQGNAQRLCSAVEEDLLRCRDELGAERKRASEAEASLADLVKRLEAVPAGRRPESASELEIARSELEAVRRHRAALSGSEAQPESQRHVVRSPATALGEVAFFAEQRIQEYARKAIERAPIREGDVAQGIQAEKQAAASASRRSSSIVSDVLLSLGSATSGTHVVDADLMLRRASFVLASAGERGLAEGGVSRDAFEAASGRFLAAGQALTRAVNLPGLDPHKKLELEKASGEMYAKAYEYRAAGSQSTKGAVQDLGLALSWIVTNGDGEASRFSFLDANNTVPHYLDSNGNESSWGVLTTELKVLQPSEAKRLGTQIAQLPESRRARAMEILAQIVERHSSEYETMLRDGTSGNSRDAAYRALQVALEVPSRVASADTRAEGAGLENADKKSTYDSECFLLARAMRARFLLAFNDSSYTEGLIDAELEAIRSEIRKPRGAHGRGVAEVSADVEAERGRAEGSSDTSRLVRLEQELVEAQVREARRETLIARMDGLAISTYTQLAANTSSRDRERFAQRVTSVVDDAIARDEANLLTQRKLVEISGLDELQKKNALESVHKGMRARHADLILATVQAYSAAGRFDLAQKKLALIEAEFAGEMSDSTATIVKRVRERLANGEPWSAAFTAVLNEAQTGGSLTQSLGYAGTGAAAGAAIGVWFFGVGAPVGAVIGGVAGLVADKTTNVVRGRSRIGAAFGSGVSGIEGWQTGVNVLTLGVDIVTVWLPLRGAGGVVSKVGFGGLARGTLTAEARATFSSQLSRMLAEAGVHSTQELGEQGVRQVAGRMVRQELLHGMGQHGGKILIAQVGTAGGMYGYNRFSIELNESLTQQQKEIALQQLNQEAVTHAGVLVAMVGAGALMGRSANRAWSVKTERLVGVGGLNAQEQAAARSVIQRWGANLRPAVMGGSGSALPSSSVIADTPPAAKPDATMTPQSGNGAGPSNTTTAVPDKKVFGRDAARALTELAKEPALQNPKGKEILKRLFTRYDGRGGSLNECYLLESEIKAARAGRLLENPGVPPSGDASGGSGGGGGSDRGPTRPSSGGDEGGSSSGELEYSQGEHQIYSDDFRKLVGGAGNRKGVIENSLGGSRARAGGAAVMDRPLEQAPRMRVPRVRPARATPEAVRPSAGSVMESTVLPRQQGGAIDEIVVPRLRRGSPSTFDNPAMLEPADMTIGRRIAPLTVDSYTSPAPIIPVGPLADPLIDLKPADVTIGRRAPLPDLESTLPLPEVALPETLLRSTPRVEVPTRLAREIERLEVDLAPLRRTAPVQPLSRESSELSAPFIPAEPLADPLIDLEPADITIGRRAPLPDLESMPEATDTSAMPLPTPRVASRPNPEVAVRAIPQPQPEAQSSKSKVAQQTEEQSKRKREHEEGAGSDITRKDESRKVGDRSAEIEGAEGRMRKRDKRRSGKRIGRRVVAGEIGSLMVDEDQQTEYDKNQFTSSRLRTNEGRED